VGNIPSPNNNNIFQFLLGCFLYQQNVLVMVFMKLSIPSGMLQQDAHYRLHQSLFQLSIPSGMLRLLTIIMIIMIMITFNSFWDASKSVSKDVKFIAPIFQFLLGCFNSRRNGTRIRNRTTFNSFWDASA